MLTRDGGRVFLLIPKRGQAKGLHAWGFPLVRRRLCAKRRKLRSGSMRVSDSGCNEGAAAQRLQRNVGKLTGVWFLLCVLLYCFAELCGGRMLSSHLGVECSVRVRFVRSVVRSRSSCTVSWFLWFLFCREKTVRLGSAIIET
jgi:hypothetical protein